MELPGIIAALMSAASWALATLIFDWIGRYIPPAGCTFIKGVLSIMLLGTLALVFGELGSADTTECIYLGLSGVIGIALGDTFFFKSLNDLGAKVQVLFFLLGQIVTMVLCVLFLGEVLSLKMYVGASVLLCGVLIVIWGKQEGHPDKARGVVFGILSILCFSVSSIIIKKNIAHVDIFTATLYRMFFGTIFILFVGVTSSRIAGWIKPLARPRVLLAFLANVIIITFGGFLLSMYAFKNIPVSLASILGVTEPVFVLLFAYMLFRDKATKRELIGAAVSVAGVIMILLNG